MSGRSAKTSRSWCIAGLLLVVAMQWTALWAATPISTCDTLVTQPGDYILTQDLLCPVNGVLIVASRVTLNLNGHNLAGNGPQYIGIAVGYPGFAAVSEVTIVGPSTISNFGTGIVFFGAEHSSVRMVTSARNSAFGFSVQGLQGRLSRINTFENNMATSNQNAGFEITDAEQNTFRANVSTGNKYGFDVAPVAHENRLEGNTASNNFVLGIITDRDATRNVIHGNTAHNNPGDDLFEENPDCDNAWENNSFGTANKPCIAHGRRR